MTTYQAETHVLPNFGNINTTEYVEFLSNPKNSELFLNLSKSLERRSLIKLFFTNLFVFDHLSAYECSKNCEISNPTYSQLINT
jgi:hypothetical protein